MHRRLRIAYSKRMELTQADIDNCDACIRHIIACPTCREMKACELGDALFYGFKVAQARSKLLLADTDYAK
jgi:hypothetical protein